MNIQNLESSGCYEIKKQLQFKWSSGIESPIYFDARKIISYPSLVKEVTHQLVKEITPLLKNETAIAGVASGGVPWASFLSYETGLPLVYIRKKAKSHGKAQLIEGFNDKIKNVIVIEDIISTGSSCLNAVRTLQENGLNILGIQALYSYNLVNNVGGVNYQSLFHFHDLVETIRDLEHRDWITNWKKQVESHLLS